MRCIRSLATLAVSVALLGAVAARAGVGPSCVAPPAGLASWWPGQDSAEDVQGSNEGTLQNGATFAAAQVGNGFSFDGVDDFVSVGDDASLTPQVFTLSAWFRSAAAADPAAAFLVARSGSDGVSGYELGVFPPSGALRFTLNGGAGGADLTGATAVLDDAFHHVTASYDGATMRLFLDGVLDAELAVATAIAYPAGASFTIGRRERAAIPGFWTGVVDEVQLFAGHALCAAEAAAIAGAGSAGQCPGGVETFCLDPFLCYKAKPTKGGPGFAGGGAILEGPIESLEVTVKKPAALCLPADLDGAPAEDDVTHLEAYAIKPATAPMRLGNLAVTTAFGTLVLDTVKVDRLLVPTAKSLSEPPVAPAAGLVDIFQCYTVKVTKGTAKFPKGVQAELADQFEAARTLDLKKPKRLCLPVGIDGSPVAQPAARLLCYPVKPAKGEPRHTRRTGVFLANASGAEQVDTLKEEQLCVPATGALSQ